MFNEAQKAIIINGNILKIGVYSFNYLLKRFSVSIFETFETETLNELVTTKVWDYEFSCFGTQQTMSRPYLLFLFYLFLFNVDKNKIPELSSNFTFKKLKSEWLAPNVKSFPGAGSDKLKEQTLLNTCRSPQSI